MRVLVVEDEVKMASLIRRGLRDEGLLADVAVTGEDALWMAAATAYDAIVLDVGLPRLDGFGTVRRLREDGVWAPVLMLTARDAIEDRVAGLDTGADDYLVKPFAMAELVARTKALLRRPGHALGVTLEAGNVALDTVGRDVRVGAAVLPLPRQELAILEHLMRRLGRVVPKAVLEEKLYGTDETPESNAVPVHVHHLRRKLAEAGATPEIHTVRGIGYLLAERPG